ncbi:Zn-ribbon domain-containing OB-fold protein [Pseudorhodoferax sp. Leaf265]|uniref:Zn-ribbon domain-containing OB-fold protein n=1 Tax=Pseudorhodoferax sp. Leaf265 TaxID=1736315 RepID=UPI0007015EE3|nr:Zn-ribbon domain-containing OB-fold protein [Pseudorhodoferax sp. Leaf265]KQP19319.1 DNA-binding protein [Pseudorhodoferax sp. Leaf265]
MTLDVHKVVATRPYPPRVSTFTKPFWSALNEGRFTTTQCRECHRQTFPPKLVCPHCWSDKYEWVDMPVEGELYSWTRIHAAPAVFQPLAPYVVGIVDLDGRTRLACPLVVPDGVQVSVGSKVRMVVMAFDDGPLFAARVLGA